MTYTGGEASPGASSVAPKLSPPGQRPSCGVKPQRRRPGAPSFHSARFEVKSHLSLRRPGLFVLGADGPHRGEDGRLGLRFAQPCGYRGFFRGELARDARTVPSKKSVVGHFEFLGLAPFRSDSCTRGSATRPEWRATGSSSRYLGPPPHPRRGQRLDRRGHPRELWHQWPPRVNQVYTRLTHYPSLVYAPSSWRARPRWNQGDREGEPRLTPLP
jgi:hypothetical protein